MEPPSRPTSTLDTDTQAGTIWTLAYRDHPLLHHRTLLMGEGCKQMHAGGDICGLGVLTLLHGNCTSDLARVFLMQWIANHAQGGAFS